MAENAVTNLKCMDTSEGNILVCCTMGNRQWFAYMNPLTGNRVTSKGEIKRKDTPNPLPTSIEWGWAKREWNKKVRELTYIEEGFAKILFQQLEENPFFGFSEEEYMGVKK